MINTKKQIAIALFALVLSFLAIALAQNASDIAMTNASIKINESQVTNLSADLNLKVNKSGDAMTGILNINYGGTGFQQSGSIGSGNSIRQTITNSNSGGWADLFLFNNVNNYFGIQLGGSTNSGSFAGVSNAKIGKFVTDADTFVIGTQGANHSVIIATDVLGGSGARVYFTDTYLAITYLNSTGTHAVCTYGNNLVVSSTNATSNYLTC